MANKTIGDLTAATGLDSADLVEIEQGGNSRKATVAQLRGAAAGAWTLAASWTFASAVANVDFTDLSGATDILILARGITLSSSGQAIVRVSTNNGSSFYAASGDYVAVLSDGTESNSTGQPMWDANATAARTGLLLIHAANNAAPRLLEALNIDPSATTRRCRLFVADPSNDIDAVRIIPSAGNISGGSIYVFTR